ncbi:ATP-binding protein [Kitasatospora nipponensis]|uniref:ATP-binding protein n=1 Tax=Kitasatospora nipponensis TaxID=258049 RepID=A0ABP4GY35_9ACTN
MRDGPPARWGDPTSSRDRTPDRRLGLGRETSGAVSRCRTFTWEVLVDWGWLPAFDEEHQAAADDVLLVVSELVANACLHAGGPTELSLHHLYRPREAVRVEVADLSPRLPVPRLAGRAAQLGQPGGHGLRIVAVVARRWGSLPTSTGKRVWAEVGAEGPGEQTPPDPGTAR